jgi:16S rRNA C1402 N4-methylase RsmH
LRDVSFQPPKTESDDRPHGSINLVPRDFGLSFAPVSEDDRGFSDREAGSLDIVEHFYQI